MQSSFIKEIVDIVGPHAKIHNNKVTVLQNGLTLTVYDFDNLLGFKLEGAVEGKNIYLVHDTDNYQRGDTRYKELYSDARKDTIHVSKAFMQGKIEPTVQESKRWFKKNKKAVVTIPDKNGRIIPYESPTVNAVNFFEGYSQ